MATPLEQLKQAFDQGDFNVCETIIMRTRELKGEPSPQFHKLASNVFRKRESFLEALFHDQCIIKLRPNDPIGYYRSGQDLLNLSRAEDALEQATEGLKHSGDHHPSLHLIAMKAYRAGDDHINSLTHALALIKLMPNEPLGFIRAGQDLIRINKYEKAKEVINSGLEKHVNNEDLLKLSIHIATITNNIFSEIDTISEFIRLYPSADNLTKCRKLYRTLGFRQKALSISKQLAQQDTTPHQNESCELFSDYLALGEPDQAFQLAAQTGLLTSNEQHRLQSLLCDEGPIALSPQDRQLLCTMNIFSQLETPSFNPEAAQVLSTSLNKPTIALIHIGKCAGESILEAIRLNFNSNEVDLYEFHIFDANKRIKTLLSQCQDKHQLHWIICTRDPLQRWISAFNWDNHTFHQSKHYMCHPRATAFHQHYPSAKSLAAGLNQNSSEAIAYAKFHHLAYGHIAMGADWYLPAQTRQYLKPTQSSIIRTEEIQNDYDLAVQSILNQFQALRKRQPCSVPMTKQSYQDRYPKKTFHQLSDLTPQEQNAISRLIKEDITSNNDIIKHLQ